MKVVKKVKTKKRLSETHGGKLRTIVLPPRKDDLFVSAESNIVPPPPEQTDDDETQDPALSTIVQAYNRQMTEKEDKSHQKQDMKQLRKINEKLQAKITSSIEANNL